MTTGGVPTRSTNPAGTPTPTPAPTPTPSPSPSTGSGTGAVQVTVSPNPVPFSGQAITDIASCATRPNTWFYDQVLRETAGVAVTITRRVDSFDGAAGSATNPKSPHCGERFDDDPHALVQRLLVGAHRAVDLQRHRRERKNVERHWVARTPAG